MFKAVVFATLAACALAGTFTPKVEPCAYHEYDSEYENWVMLKDDHTGYLAMINHTSGDHEFIRCDVKNDKGECAYLFFPAEGKCEKYWTDKSEYWLDMDFQLNWLNKPFEYDGEPVDVQCPNTPAPAPAPSSSSSSVAPAPASSSAAPVPPTPSSSAAPAPASSSAAPAPASSSSSSAAPAPASSSSVSSSSLSASSSSSKKEELLATFTHGVRGNITSLNCKKYSNSTHYIIADDQNRIVRSPEGWIITYTDDTFTTDVFKTTDCNEDGTPGKDLGVPADVCGASSIFASAIVLVLAALVALF